MKSWSGKLFGVLLVLLRCLLGGSWGLLRRLGWLLVSLGASWGHLGASWQPLGGLLGSLGGLLKPLGAILGRLGAKLEWSWATFGALYFFNNFLE